MGMFNSVFNSDGATKPQTQARKWVYGVLATIASVRLFEDE